VFRDTAQGKRTGALCNEGALVSQFAISQGLRCASAGMSTALIADGKLYSKQKESRNGLGAYERANTIVNRQDSPLSARSVGRSVEFFTGRPEEREYLLVERLESEDNGLGGVRSMADMEEVDALETLEDPAHRGPRGRLVDLAGDGLPCRSQLLAEAMLGEPIHQQTDDHHQTQGHDALGLYHEDRGG
jgi:hypothetical protein